MISASVSARLDDRLAPLSGSAPEPYLTGRCWGSRYFADLGPFLFDVYVVLDDFGKLGRAYRETDESRGPNALELLRTLLHVH
jgi:hypothetical protein